MDTSNQKLDRILGAVMCNGHIIRDLRGPFKLCLVFSAILRVPNLSHSDSMIQGQGYTGFIEQLILLLYH